MLDTTLHGVIRSLCPSSHAVLRNVEVIARVQLLVWSHVAAFRIVTCPIDMFALILPSVGGAWQPSQLLRFQPLQLQRHPW